MTLSYNPPRGLQNGVENRAAGESEGARPPRIRFDDGRKTFDHHNPRWGMWKAVDKPCRGDPVWSPLRDNRSAGKTPGASPRPTGGHPVGNAVPGVPRLRPLPGERNAEDSVPYEAKLSQSLARFSLDSDSDSEGDSDSESESESESEYIKTTRRGKRGAPTTCVCFFTAYSCRRGCPRPWGPGSSSR
jgi:hypothetical protein